MYKLFDEASLVNAKPIQTKFLLLLIETSINKAIIQHQRIMKIKKKIPKLMMKNINVAEKIRNMAELKKSRTMLFSDLHHYFICWGEVNRLYIYLNKIQPLFTLPQKYLNELKIHCDFRNHLEHLEERIERGVTDLGNMFDDEFSFNNVTIDVSVTDLMKLKELYLVLINIAKNEFTQPRFRTWGAGMLQ